MKDFTFVFEAKIESLDGLTLAQVRKFLSKELLTGIGGLFRDEYWQGPKKVWDKLNALNVDWNLTDNRYGKDKDNPTGPDKYKEWKFDVNFTNDKGKPAVVRGVLTAHGAGTVKDPLSAYDMTLSIY